MPYYLQQFIVLQLRCFMSMYYLSPHIGGANEATMHNSIYASINQCPGTDSLKFTSIPSEGCGVHYEVQTPQANTYSLCRVKLRLPEKNLNSLWHDGTQTCDSGSTVECFNYSATSHPHQLISYVTIYKASTLQEMTKQQC